MLEGCWFSNQYKSFRSLVFIHSTSFAKPKRALGIHGDFDNVWYDSGYDSTRVECSRVIFYSVWPFSSKKGRIWAAVRIQPLKDPVRLRPDCQLVGRVVGRSGAGSARSPKRLTAQDTMPMAPSHPSQSNTSIVVTCYPPPGYFQTSHFTHIRNSLRVG